MFNCKIFEKTPLQAYNEKLDIFQIKFDIFSELQEFQKIGRMSVSKDEFFVSKKEKDEMKKDVEKEDGEKEDLKKEENTDEKIIEDEEIRKKIQNRLKIISKFKQKKLIRDITNVKLYVEEVKENDNKEETENKEVEKEESEGAEEEAKEEEEAKGAEEEAKEEEEKYDIYYIFDIGYFQKLSRWWYSENREKTKKYITEDFSEFVKYLNEIKNMYSYYSVNIYYKNLLKKIHKFINKITPGLYNLKKTYTDNKEIKAQVDSIILTMLDFKNETEIKKIKSSNSILSLLHQHNKTHILI